MIKKDLKKLEIKQKNNPVNKEDEMKGFKEEHKKRKGINYGIAEKTEYRMKDKTKKGTQFDR